MSYTTYNFDKYRYSLHIYTHYNKYNLSEIITIIYAYTINI